MFKRFSSTLSPFVFFRLDTDRLVLLSMALMMPLIQMMHPLPQRISLLQQVLAYAVISCSLLVFCCSLFSFMSRRYVYVAILFLGSLLGIYLLMSLHSLKFAPTFKTAYLLLILLFPWYLENKRNLILFLGLNTLGALYTLVTTAGPGEQAYHFLIGLLLANSFMYVLVGDHIEQQRELSRKGVYYRRIIEKLNDGVLQMDAKGTITMANQSFCQIIGYRRRDIIGQMHISALISKENRKILARHLKDRKKGRSG
ncbi:MAG: PAS domain S-box protein, partial [Bacteroidetes bacterium]